MPQGLDKETEKKIARLMGLHEETDDETPGQTARSGLPQASLRGKPEDEDDEAMGKAIHNFVEYLTTKYGADPRLLKEFDDVISRVFQPKAGSENFTNLRTPGQPEPKISAKPGQSGSSTGRAGAGTSTYPNSEGKSGNFVDDTGHSYTNPTSGAPRSDVPAQGQGSRAWRDRIHYDTEGSTKPGVGYNPRPLGKAFDLEHGASLERGSPRFEKFLADRRNQLTKAQLPPGQQLDEEDVISGLPTSAQRVTDEGEAEFPQSTPPAPVPGIPGADEAAARFDEESDDEEAKAKEAKREGKLEEAKKHAQLAQLAQERAATLRKRVK